MDMCVNSSFILRFHRGETRLKILSRVTKCFEKNVSSSCRKIQKIKKIEEKEDKEDKREKEDKENKEIKAVLFQTFM